MRKIILLIMSLSIGYVCAQDVAVNLSIVWKSEKVSIDSSIVMDVPYLNITYHKCPLKSGRLKIK